MNNPPFPHILLATSHTEFDVGAERLALQMARSYGLPLAVVLPVLSNPEFEAEAPQLAQRADRDAATKIDELRSQAQTAGVELNIIVRHGAELYREIVDEATLRGSDLIIIRRRGTQSFLANLLLGEMVNKVVGYAPCNILIVPRASTMWTHGILVAVDDTPSAGKVVATAAAIAITHALPLTIISIANTPEMQKKAEAVVARNMAVATTIGAHVQGHITIGKPYEQILAEAKLAGADLIVLGRHGDNVLTRMYLGSTLQQVAELTQGSVLVVHV